MPETAQSVKYQVARWHVYMVECFDGTFYTGITTDIDRRIKEHNCSPLGARYTRARRPVTLCYREHAASRSAALKREHQIKKLSTTKKRQLSMQEKTKTQPLD